MQFPRVPLGFLEGVRIVPHNFDDPENKAHGDYVDAEMKHDLFNEVYTKVKVAESGGLGAEQYFRLESVGPCGGEESWVEKVFSGRVAGEEDRLIACHDLQVDFNGQEKHLYRAKIYQSQEDRFFSLVFPQGWTRSLRLFLLYGYE